MSDLHHQYVSKRKVFDTLGYVTTFRDSNTLNMLSRTGHKSDVNCIKFDNVALQSNRNYFLSDCGTILWPPVQPIITAAMAQGRPSRSHRAGGDRVLVFSMTNGPVYRESLLCTTLGNRFPKILLHERYF
jgi:hypothetical protein